MSNKNKSRQSTSQEPESDAPDNQPAPARLRLVSHYGFYDNEGLLCAWAQGAIVTDEGEIELLMARGAPVEEIME
jgi:hypothetical protein